MTTSPHAALKRATAELRHLYSNLKDTLGSQGPHPVVKAWADEIADRLLAPQIEALERLANDLAALADAPVPPVCERCKGTGFEADTVFVCAWCHGHGEGEVPPATSSDWEAAEHTAGTYAGPVQAINVPPATAGETFRLSDVLKWADCHVSALTDARIASWHVLRAEMIRDALKQLAALPAPAPQGETQGEDMRAFIERKFREGMREAEEPLGSRTPPYEETSLAAHWWTRGYAYRALQLAAALSASPPPLSEQALREQAEAYVAANRMAGLHAAVVSPDDLVAFILSLHRPPDAPGEAEKESR